MVDHVRGVHLYILFSSYFQADSRLGSFYHRSRSICLSPCCPKNQFSKRIKYFLFAISTGIVDYPVSCHCAWWWTHTAVCPRDGTGKLWSRGLTETGERVFGHLNGLRTPNGKALSGLAIGILCNSRWRAHCKGTFTLFCNLLYTAFNYQLCTG
jgi:hypothetical protein